MKKVLTKKAYLKHRIKHGWKRHWYGLAPNGKYTVELKPEYRNKRRFENNV